MESTLDTFLSSSSGNSNDFHGNGNSSSTGSGKEGEKVVYDAELNQSGNQEDETRTENPFLNYVILKTLLKNCATRDLIPFRLVSRQWNSISKPLLKKSSYRLSLHYDHKQKTYTKDNEPSKTLSQLNRILSTTTDFPVTNFCFYFGVLDCPEALEFFKSHGDKIRGLLLDLKNGQGTPRDRSSDHLPVEIPYKGICTLRKILLEHTKNMQNFILSGIPKEWEEDSAPELFPEPRNTIQLPGITTLVFMNFTSPKAYRLAQDIIQAAVNLEIIHEYKIEFFDPLATAFENKIHAVKKIRFFPTEENVDLYLKFGEGAPKLEMMGIGSGILKNSELDLGTRKKIVKTLQLILESSKENLKKISGLIAITRLPTFKFPRMQQISMVKCTDDLNTGGLNNPTEFFLLFNFNVESTFTNVPRNLDLASNFPALERITFDFLSSRNFETCCNCFESSSSKTQKPLHSVKYVDLSCGNFSPVPFIEKMTGLFPALQNFRLFLYIGHFQQTMPIVWKGFPNLKTLELVLDNKDQDEIITENLDSGICGFAPETCVQLKKNSRNVKFEDVEALRENPSICDAKKLSQLTIKFSTFSFESDQLMARPLFSAVSGIFGFDLVRKRNGTKILLERPLEKQIQLGLGEIVPYIDGFVEYLNFDA